MVTFLTVLKSAKKFNNYELGHSGYTPAHVYALQDQIKRFYPEEHKFICLTDYENMNCSSIKLTCDLPGWWSKIELFRPDIYQRFKDKPFVYFDLDTVILNDISKFVDYPHKFSALSDKIERSLLPGRLWSGIMAWRGDYTYLFKEFMKNPSFSMERSRQSGDQHFIHDMIQKFKPIHEIMPGCVSFKELQENNITESPKIIYFYGEQKPWNVDHPLIDQNLYKR